MTDILSHDEEIAKHMALTRQKHKEDASQDTFNLLLMGRMGAGKTYMMKTARKPVLIHSFDPGGTKGLEEEKKNGSIIVNSAFEQDTLEKPKAFNAWMKEFAKLLKLGVFDRIGTYVIDGLTMLISAAKTQLHDEFKSKTPNGVLDQARWQLLQIRLTNSIKLFCGQSCDFILMSHIHKGEDPFTQAPIRVLAAPPSLQVGIPILFDEIWDLQIKNTSKGPDRHIVTAISANTCARTRIGTGVFNLAEEPHIKNLLRKAGRPCEDKLLF